MGSLEALPVPRAEPAPGGPCLLVASGPWLGTALNFFTVWCLFALPESRLRAPHPGAALRTLGKSAQLRTGDCEDANRKPPEAWTSGHRTSD